MSQKKVLTDLLGLQGWRVKIGEIYMDREAVILPIERCAGHGYQCSQCTERMLIYYDRQPPRMVRDFPIWGRRCYLKYTPVRVACPTCQKVVTERLDWIEPYQRLTLRYERYVARLCDILPVLDVAELEGLGKDAVYRLDRKWLERRHSQRAMQPVVHLGIDEISLRKGHRYATVFYDLDRREVIGLVKGRRQRQVSGFFRRWGKAMCKQVKAVCMDLWSAYLNSVRLHLKKARVVFDKFHVYRYLSEAIDQVRRDEQNQADEQGKQLIKGSRWLWLKKAERLKRHQNQTLLEIMAVNISLQKAYLLKEDFRRFYEHGDPQSAAAFLEEWMARCRESQLEPFLKLARRLKRWSHGILAYFDCRITNGISEGINNKIKVLKRRAYGFHDMKYFFLKIMNITGHLSPLEVVTHNY
jgi:transposase